MSDIKSDAALLNAASRILTLLKIPFSKKYTDHFLTTHVDYPSLSSLSALLDDFNIENVALKLSDEQLSQIPSPLLTYLPSDQGGNFAVVLNQTAESITYYNPGIKENISIPREEFRNKWEGVSLLFEANQYSRSHANEEFVKKNSRRKFYQTVNSILLLILFLQFASSYDHLTWPIVYLMVAKVAGATAGLLLLFKDVGIKSSLTDKICKPGNSSSRFGCDKVASSNASTFLGVVRMSEVGLFYFIGGIIYLLVSHFASRGDEKIILATVTTLALPYTLFSIYYQSFVVKQICPLCMIVVACIWSEFGILLFANAYSYSLPLISSIGLASLSFFLPVLFWFTFREFVYDSQLVDPLNKKLKFFTGSGEALQVTLAQNKATLNNTLVDTIRVNDNGHCKIIAVLSPLCGPCASTFQEILILSAKYPNVQFDLVFYTGTEITDILIKRIVLEKLINGHQSVMNYLDKWYKKEVDTFVVNPVNPQAVDHEIADKIMKSWGSWLTTNSIPGTPTVIINGNYKPMNFSLYDFEPMFKMYNQTN